MMINFQQHSQTPVSTFEKVRAIDYHFWSSDDEVTGHFNTTMNNGQYRGSGFIQGVGGWLCGERTMFRAYCLCWFVGLDQPFSICGTRTTGGTRAPSTGTRSMNDFFEAIFWSWSNR